jgi:hypothetical protein
VSLDKWFRDLPSARDSGNCACPLFNPIDGGPDHSRLAVLRSTRRLFRKVSNLIKQMIFVFVGNTLFID